MSNHTPERPMKDAHLLLKPEKRQPLLVISIPDSEETRTLILGLIEEDDDLRAATEAAIITLLREPMLAYARKQAVRIKQGKLT
jgi:hypothetical protein